jgi:hypothetical protein
MKTLTQFKSELSETEKEQLIGHFDEIYVCSQLDDHEYKMAYLAYLWKNGRVINDMNEGHAEIINEKELGVELFRDYEITVEADETEQGGVNLDLMYDFYRFDELILISESNI